MKFYVTSLRAKNQNIELPIGLDPQDPDLRSKAIREFKSEREPFIRQSIFIHQNDEKFFDYAEERVLEKMKKDIVYILERGWGNEISTNDFYHGFICGKSKVPLFDMDKLFARENIALFYYTHCAPPGHGGLEPLLKPEHINSNIKSTLTSEPVVVHPNYELFEYPFYIVDPHDLGLMTYACINFEENPNGPYILSNGKRVNIWGSLFKDFYWHFIPKNNQRTPV